MMVALRALGCWTRHSNLPNQPISFNRLVQVNDAVGLQAADFTNGKLTTAPGPRVWAFVYDALGRLIRADRYEPDGPAPADRLARSEAYYYDGVRRIQEIVTTYPPIPGEPETVVREYVWGPDYVDELVAQCHRAG